MTLIGAWLSFATQSQDIGSLLLRSGLVISMLALALPQVERFFYFFPPWLLACGAVGGFAILRWPRTAVFVLPGLAVLWFLGPRSKMKQEPRKKKGPVVKDRSHMDAAAQAKRKTAHPHPGPLPKGEGKKR